MKNLLLLFVMLLGLYSCCNGQPITDLPDQIYYATDSCDFFLPDYSEELEVKDNCCVEGMTQNPPPGTKLTVGTTAVTILAMDCAGNSTTLNFNAIVVDNIPPEFWPVDTIPPVEPPDTTPPPIDPDFPEDKVSVWWNDFEQRAVGDYTEAMVEADWPWHTYWPAGRNSYMDDADYIKIEDHNGTNVFTNIYLEGQWGLETGVNIYSVMTPKDGWRKMYLSYNVMFVSPFDWGLGGKMPGFSAIPFSGPGSPDPDEGCNVRMMWQPDGKAIMYNYFHRDYDYDYGEGYGLDMQFEQDVWHHITITLEMGDTGVANGICEVYFDGIKVGSWTGNMTHEQPGIWVSAIAWSSFMGGGTPNYAPAWDQKVLFDDAETWYRKDEPRGPGLNDIRAYLRNFPKQ